MYVLLQQAIRRRFYFLFTALCMIAGNSLAHTANIGTVNNNTWVRINQGSVTSHPNILSYSGGWYDPVFHQFCIFGGGHWDYSGNEVWCFDISAQSWSREYQPDVIRNQTQTEGGDPGDYANYENTNFPGVLFSPSGESIADANPISKHTYDQMEFVDGLGPIVYGGYGWGDGRQGWCDICFDTWAYRYNAAKWNYLYDGSNPAPDDEAGEGASAYSTLNGLMYVQSRSETWTYDPRSNTWDQLTTSGELPFYIHAVMEYDPVGNQFYLFGGNFYQGSTERNQWDLYRFNPTTRVWSRLSPSGTGPGTPTLSQSRGMGLAFDTFNNVLLVYRSGNIWVYDPSNTTSSSDGHWTQQTTLGDIPANSDQVYGRFRFDPVNNGAWLHGMEGSNHTTWFYRYQNQATPPSPVVSMYVDPPTLAAGGTINVYWGVSNSSSCTASDAWSGSKASTGNETLNIIGNSATLTLNCTGPGGPASRSVTITDVGIGGGGSAIISNPVPAPPTTSQTNETSSGGSGGGAIGLHCLLLLAIAGFRRKRRL